MSLRAMQEAWGLQSNGNFRLQTRMSWQRLSAGRSQSRMTQNDQTTQHWRLLPRRCCNNHGSVRDVITRRTSHLENALFVKGIFNLITVRVKVGEKFWKDCEGGYICILLLNVCNILTIRQCEKCLCCELCNSYWTGWDQKQLIIVLE